MYEFTLRGFNGETDETDHLILWIHSTLDRKALMELLREHHLLEPIGLIATVSEVPADVAAGDQIDFELPKQLVELKARAELLCSLTPIAANYTGLSISDDDLCASCAHCDYRPGEISQCDRDWPGLRDSNHYVQACRKFQPTL